MNFELFTRYLSMAKVSTLPRVFVRAVEMLEVGEEILQ